MQNSMERLAEAIDKYIRPGTYPVAVRLLRRDEEVPAGYVEPAQAYGQRIALCQAVFLARRMGAYTVVAEEDQACPIGHIVMGFVEPPAYWLEGDFDLAAGRTSTLEAGAVMAGSVFRFQPGEYSRVAVAPLHTAKFDPDLVLVYCNTLQATMLGMGARHGDAEKQQWNERSHGILSSVASVASHCPRRGESFNHGDVHACSVISEDQRDRVRQGSSLTGDRD